ncbi:MOSC domain-containing protein [Lysinibacillus sp. SGAir0095]|uniref:MOSC domain-containing protein n=1 Tax=Lysinibacillus sp. SGAir0095 TaxID=2070463 RepID=UPI0010CD227F|nr:MOSC domain-containing protein [Lysinibacillus sp. SGAir0095]QCR32725.1 MOSC domain-containing protein [Lysinibacillus sp. SGAir0095]
MRNHHVPILKTFSIGLPKEMTYENNKQIETAICKESVTEAFLTKDGFVGDGVADLKHHGGPDRAVCVYPYEHYALWEKEFGASLPKSTFGENITVTNMLEEDVYIGDIYELGDAVIQITQGRVPCSTINKRVGIPLIMKRMVETGFTGYFCRVLQEGIVRSDSQIRLIEKHPKAISILFGNEVYFKRPKDNEAMQSLLSVEELAEEWKGYMTKRLAKLTTI